MDREDELLLSRLDDAVRSADFGAPKFIGFLDERQRSVLTGALRHRADVRAVFYGGFLNAQRTLLGIFPAEEQCDVSLFPLRLLRAEFRKQDRLSHRDMLGALMGLELKREAVGDIQIGEGRAFFAIRAELTDFVLQHFTKAGRVGIRLSSAEAEEQLPPQRMEELSGVVASLRLDCVVAMLCKKSRGSAAELIHAGRCFINHVQEQSPTKRVSAGDCVSVRGIGKFLLQDGLSETQKGRVRLSYLKYL